MSNNDNLFEFASREKLRFPSPRGQLTVEQLWDLNLTSKDGFDLDVIAKAVNKELKSVTEESFVQAKKTSQQSKHELSLDIVKHIIATKEKEQEAAVSRAEKKVMREKLKSIIASKQDQKLESMSEDALLKMLDSVKD